MERDSITKMQAFSLDLSAAVLAICGSVENTHTHITASYIYAPNAQDRLPGNKINKDRRSQMGNLFWFFYAKKAYKLYVCVVCVCVFVFYLAQTFYAAKVFICMCALCLHKNRTGHR